MPKSLNCESRNFEDLYCSWCEDVILNGAEWSTINGSVFVLLSTDARIINANLKGLTYPLY